MNSQNKHRCIPVSMSLATTWAAPHSFAAMAEAPQPLPRSRTVLSRHTPGLSKRYLQTGGTRWDLIAVTHTNKTAAVVYYEVKILPWECLSSWPIYSPVRVIERPELWPFTPKSAVLGEQSQFHLWSQALFSNYLCVLGNKSPDILLRLTANWEWLTSVYRCGFKWSAKYLYITRVCVGR